MWCIAVLAWLGGCASSPTAREAGPEASPTAPTESGLELRLWVVEGDAMRRSIGAFERGTPPAPPAQLALWRANGLAVASVSAEDVPDLLASVRTVGPRQTQWLGMLHEWSVLASGPPLASDSGAELDAGTLELGAGRLRLLGRAWPLPPAPGGDRPRLRVDLAPQFVEAGPSDRDPQEFVNAPRLSRDEDAGPVYHRLELELVAEGEEAFVVFADEPPAPQATDDGVGPPLPDFPRLGRMLLGGAPGSHESEMRLVLVLVPRTPTRFGVLAP